MAINLENIYCNHFLKNNRLQEFCKNPKFESFVYPTYTSLTSFHVKDTLHYNALINNDYKNYEEYIKTTNQKEHSVDIFLNLKNNFDLNKMEKIKLEYNLKTNKYFVTDGVHRLSILLYKNIINDNIPIKYLDIQLNIDNYNKEFHIKSGSSNIYYLKQNNEIKYVFKELFRKPREKFIKETYALDKLSNYKYFPKIIYRNEDKNYFIMNYCGNHINKKNLPKNWLEQINEIKKKLYKHDIAHGDINQKNICIINNTIILIDFGNIRFKSDIFFKDNSYENYIRKQHSKLNEVIDLL